MVVNVSHDTTAQNETPLAVNPRDPNNLITGNNDWNYNDGCGVNASFDGGKSWTPTLPNGFLPGVTKYTNDPDVPGAGVYDFGGDPAVAFGPDGTAYFACFGYQGTPPYGVALLLSRGADGGRPGSSGGRGQRLTRVPAVQGNGKARGAPGPLPTGGGGARDSGAASTFSVCCSWQVRERMGRRRDAKQQARDHR